MLGLFGDVLFRTPILRSIKKKFPNSEITVIVDKIGYYVLYNNPNVNNLTIINRNKKNRLNYVWNKIKTQFKIIFSRFDLVVDLYNGSSSRNMARLSFSKFFIATDGGGREPYYDFSNQTHYTNKLFNSLYGLDLDRESMSVMPDFFINENIENRILNNYKNLKNENKYLISLGSGGLEKILETRKTYEIIKHLYNFHDLIPMIVSNPDQEFLQENLINDFLVPNGIDFVKLDNKSIDEIAVFIKNSKFFIVPDTGLMHLAFALKTPVFCIFTYTHPLYVQPEDESYIYGLSYKIKEPKEFDNFNMPRCTKDIEFSQIKSDLDNFIDRVKNG